MLYVTSGNFRFGLWQFKKKTFNFCFGKLNLYCENNAIVKYKICIEQFHFSTLLNTTVGKSIIQVHKIKMS